MGKQQSKKSKEKVSAASRGGGGRSTTVINNYYKITVMLGCDVDEDGYKYPKYREVHFTASFAKMASFASKALLPLDLNCRRILDVIIQHYADNSIFVSGDPLLEKVNYEMVGAGIPPISSSTLKRAMAKLRASWLVMSAGKGAYHLDPIYFSNLDKEARGLKIQEVMQRALTGGSNGGGASSLPEIPAVLREAVSFSGPEVRLIGS